MYVCSKSQRKSSGEEDTCTAVQRLLSLIPDGQNIKHQVNGGRARCISHTCLRWVRCKIKKKMNLSVMSKFVYDTKNSNNIECFHGGELN